MAIKNESPSISLAAAHFSKRRFIGSESSATHFKNSVKRISAVLPDLKKVVAKFDRESEAFVYSSHLVTASGDMRTARNLGVT